MVREANSVVLPPRRVPGVSLCCSTLLNLRSPGCDALPSVVGSPGHYLSDDGSPWGHARPACAGTGVSDTFREELSVSSMDMDVGDLIVGWDWISSHDLRLLYVDGRVSLRSGPA